MSACSDVAPKAVDQRAVLVLVSMTDRTHVLCIKKGNINELFKPSFLKHKTTRLKCKTSLTVPDITHPQRQHVVAGDK